MNPLSNVALRSLVRIQRRGAALVECAITLPIFLILLMALLKLDASFRAKESETISESVEFWKNAAKSEAFVIPKSLQVTLPNKEL